MKKIKKIFILFTMLVAGLSFNSANNVEKNVVADAADVVTDADKPVRGSYAYLNNTDYKNNICWKADIINALSEQGVNDISLLKTLMITNKKSKVSTTGYVEGCPVEVGLKGSNYTPENYYTNGCAVAAYVYPNATDTTKFDCILYANVETIYAQSGDYLFSKMENVEKITFDFILDSELNCKFSMEKTTSMMGMFYSNKSLVQIEGLEYVDTTGVTSMYKTFTSCTVLETLDVSSFDTSKVTVMQDMFGWCKRLTIIKGLENWNTSQVTDMSFMFYLDEKLTSMDISHFDTSSVRDMTSMFRLCVKLNPIDVSKWNTSNVRYMKELFGDCQSITTLDVSSFDTSNVTDMTCMFGYCYKLTTIKGLDSGKFITSKVTSMASMFNYTKSLQELDLSHFDTSNVTNMRQMFRHCNLSTITFGENWDTSKVTNMVEMFKDCPNLTLLDLSDFELSNATNYTDWLIETPCLEQIIVPTNLKDGMIIKLPSSFGMTEIDSSMAGWTLLKGSKEFNILYNTLLKINVCTEYAQASDLQAMYDGLTSEEKDKLATLSDDSGVILTEKLSYMVGYADYKANEATATPGTHLVLSARSGQYLVLIIACFSLVMLGGYYFIQKKKYAK